MKRKTTLTLITLTTTIILFLHTTPLPTHANPNTIWVPDNYTTIQDAINNALRGDTIFVRAGTYQEHLFVDKALSIIGENRHKTIIDGGGNGTTIYIMATNVIITNFTIQNAQHGIWLWRSNYNTLTNNTFLNNEYAIYVWESSNNIFTNNTVSNNEYGIYLYSSGQNVLTANTASNNQDGIHIRGASRNNIIFHNNFINNTESPSSVNLENSWDNGAEGNYWSDYHGTDTNLNGIGDAPYYIDQNRKDNCPLMAPFQHFTITTENYPHKINTICNSTILNLQYHYDPHTKTNAIRFKATDTKNKSFCRITIPHTLIEPPYTITIDNNPPSYMGTLYTNETHTWLYFTYENSEHEITIKHMPYPQQLLLSQWAIFGLTIIIVILLLTTINYYRKFNAQKKIIQAYEQELGSFPTSHPERARARFVKDVIQRKEKIEKFKKKYGAKIQPATTLEELTEKLGIQKKKKVKH